MKKLEVITKSERLKDVRNLLESSGIYVASVSLMSGGCVQETIDQCDLEASSIAPLTQVKIEMIVPDVVVHLIAEGIANIIRKSGETEEDKILVFDVNNVN